MPFDPGAQIGHYRLLARLGAGGMGVVFRARDTLLERHVAVKVLPTSLSHDPDRLDRFVREARILASLNHPNIGAIYGLEQAPSGEKCLILELVDGVSLSDRIRCGAPLVDEALRICGGIAEALQAAHQGGVIHRDLKPANVMLTHRGRVKVLDFGLARQVRTFFQEADPTDPCEGSVGSSDEATAVVADILRSGLVEGTPGYMSPEQIRGEAQDQRTDIFAFGCVLYECLSGYRAFGGEDPRRTMAAPLDQNPAWERLPGETPPEIRDLLIHCLQKDPLQRLGGIDSALLDLLETGGRRDALRARKSQIKNNIPQEISSFIGREQELAECRRILEKTRLLTLSGIGGSGKTRLAIRLARAVLDDYPDGAWFIDLASISDPERVPMVVASTLDVKAEPSRTMTETLAAALSDRRTLLLLDNCEHLLPGCSSMVDALLESCANLKMILTSRQSLRLRGESLFPVQPLKLPPESSGDDASALLSSEAGRLFLDRASALNSEFRFDPTNAAAVAEICRRLDGMPLAIELAANRVRMLTVHQIREMLDDRFRLLTAGTSDLLPRHRTLNAIIQWSYDQLTAGEQRFFRLLSVFSGGWSLAAATAIGDGPNDEFAVLDTLTRLADLGLVVVDRVSGRDARYTLLETVKEYALERLIDSDEADDARARHFAYFLSLARDIDHNRLGPQNRGWRVRMELDLANMLAAHAWCDGAEERAAGGLGLVFSMRNYWLPRGFVQLGLRVSVEALRRPGAASPNLARGKVLLTAGVLAYFAGRYDEAGSHLDESLSIMREQADAPTLSTTLTGLALIAMSQNQRGPARNYLEEAIHLSRAGDDQGSLASALNTLGDLHSAEGRFDEAIASYEEAMERDYAIGNVEDGTVTFCNLGRAWISRGDLIRARAILTELLDRADEAGSKHVCSGVIDVATAFALAHRDWAFGARLHGSCDALMEESSLHRDSTDDLFLDPFLGGAREALGEDAFRAAYDDGRGVGFEKAAEEIRAWLVARRAD